MEFVKKNRRLILFLMLYGALFLLGLNIHDVLKNGISENENTFIQLSGLIATALLSLGLFWELYIAKKKNET